MPNSDFPTGALPPVKDHRQQDQEDQPEQEANNQGRWKGPLHLHPVHQMLLVIILVFTLCWFPRFLLNTIK